MAAARNLYLKFLSRTVTNEPLNLDMSHLVRRWKVNIPVHFIRNFFLNIKITNS